MSAATTAIILDTRRVLKDGTFPVKLRIIFNRTPKYFPTKYSLTEEDFAKVQSPKPRGEYKELRIAFDAIERKAIDAIEKLSVFSFEAFEKRFNTNVTTGEVFGAYEAMVERLRGEGQVGTARNYETASISLLSFLNNEPSFSGKGMTLAAMSQKRDTLLAKRKPLPFSAVTPDFLREYDRWMVSHGKSSTTVSMYLRTLRTLFNEAVAEGHVHGDLYPFGKRKYQVPASKNTKKALSKEEIKKIFLYEPKTDGEARARDYWRFSYLCYGINMKDIARLKYRQVGKDTITFIRAKTERTTRHDQRSIEVAINAHAVEIMERWGSKPSLPDTYVFPILTPGISPEREKAAVNQATKTTNKYMKRIAEVLGIEASVTTYSARHSFSTMLKRSGTATAMISEMLGHSSEKTTRNYLGSFEDELKRKAISNLTDF